MIAFDTSLIVRIAVGDNLKKKKAALSLLENNSVLLLKTVILETEWVLRSRYQLTPKEIADFLLFLTSSEGIVVEEPSVIEQALRYYQEGGDFADAIHLASAGNATLYTLDKSFCRQPIKKGVAPKVTVVIA